MILMGVFGDGFSAVFTGGVKGGGKVGHMGGSIVGLPLMVCGLSR